MEWVGSSAPPPTPDEVRRELSDGTILVEYALTGDTLITWVISRQRIEIFYKGIDSKLLERTAKRFIALLDEGIDKENVSRLAGALYRELLTPVEKSLEAGSSLVIVPDKYLAQIPFAALRFNETARYLVEDHPIVVAPSSALYLRSVQRDCELSSRISRPLVIGNPAFDRSAQSLEDLPQAANEARRVAQLLESAQPLTGLTATKRAFLALAPGASLIHLAVHGIADHQRPLLSRFLLARDPESGDSGILYAYDIYRLHLHNTRLTFLSSCSTARGPVQGREGTLDLVRPFLAAGVPSVIGSLWSVQDEATEEMVSHFYAALKAGLDPARALRKAQLEEIHEDGRHPLHSWNWAAFQLYGGTCAN
jgi:CHAT domain-containing protein